MQGDSVLAEPACKEAESCMLHVLCLNTYPMILLLLMTQLSHALRGDDSKQEVHVHIQSAQSSFKSSSCVIRQVRRGSIQNQLIPAAPQIPLELLIVVHWHRPAFIRDLCLRSNIAADRQHRQHRSKSYGAFSVLHGMLSLDSPLFKLLQ